MTARIQRRALQWVCVGLSHQTAPLAVRERLVLSEPQRLRLLQPGHQAPQEALVLATCNRVEVYMAAAEPALARADLRDALERLGGPGVLAYLYEYEGRPVLEHLFRVASGLDSMVLGEAQILGQLKQAFARARDAGAARGLLTRACAAAFSCAKRVRTETAIGRAATSLAPATVALAGQLLGPLADKTVLVVGAGQMGGLAARSLARAKVGRLLITNRTPARAATLAAEVGAHALPFEALSTLLTEADLVVCSTASPVPLFSAASLAPVIEARGSRPLLLVDLAVPRDIAPDVARLDGVTVRDVDDIQRFVAENEAARAEEARRAGLLVTQEVSRFLRERREREAMPVVAQLRQRAERIIRAELERTLTDMGEGLTDKQRRSIEAMGRAIVNKLLHEPTTCLRTGAHADDGQVLAHTAARLFGLGREGAPH